MVVTRFFLTFTMLLPLAVSGIPTYQAQHDATTNVVSRQPVHLVQALPDGGPADVVNDRRTINLISHAPTHLNLLKDVLLAKRGGSDISDGNKVTLGALAKSISVALDKWELQRQLPWNVGKSREDDKDDVAFAVSLVRGLIKGLEELDSFDKGH